MDMKNISTKYFVLVIYSVAIKLFLRNLFIIAISSVTMTTAMTKIRIELKIKSRVTYMISDMKKISLIHNLKILEKSGKDCLKRLLFTDSVMVPMLQTHQMFIFLGSAYNRHYKLII